MNRMARTGSQVWQSFSRKKCLDVHNLKCSHPKRCLSVLDLVALGLGSSLGAGLYILMGIVTKTLTGPAIVFSFLVAAFASFLSGMCYAEFAARVPKAGSAYVYSYVSVGEFWAYVIGWNMILENMIGVAASGKAWSQFVDSIFNDTIRRNLQTHISWGQSEGGWIDSYPDLLALAFLIFMFTLSCFGVKISSRINLGFTLVNISMIVFIVSVGFSKAQLSNWTESPNGFFPFGFKGVMAGAATCFYSFIGFDTISTSGEEAINPSKNVPFAIVITLFVCLVCFLGVGSVLTLLVPWDTLSHTAALPKAFAQREVYGAEYAIAVGGVCGLTASTLANIYPLPQSIYCMAQDGLLFSWLGTMWRNTEIPIVAAAVSGFLVALAAVVLDLDSLVEMMSIGTLMAYTMVAISVLVLHYQKDNVGLTALDEPIHQHAITASETFNTTDIHSSTFDITNDNADKNTNDKNLKPRHSLASSSFSTSETGLNSTTKASSSGITLTEDTGLLKVGGDGGKKVRYVPAKTTIVVRKAKPSTEIEDSEGDDEEGKKSSINLDGPQESPVVEEYRQRLRQEQLEKQKLQEQNQQTADQTPAETSKASKPFSFRLDKNSYQPMDASNLTLNTLPEPTKETRRKVIASTVFMVVAWVIFCTLSVHGPNLLWSKIPSQRVQNGTEKFRQPGKLYKSVMLGEDRKNKSSSSFLMQSFSPQPLSGTANNLNLSLTHGVNWYILVVYVVLIVAVVVPAVVIERQPKNQTPLLFTAPLVPLLPIGSILINIYLMFTLSDITWIRFIVWLLLGFIIYFAYGMWNSVERRADDQEVIIRNEQQQE